MQIAMQGRTDIGQIRQINEDSFGLFPELNSLVVCDGMGGHAAGEVASQRAVETVRAYLERGRGFTEAKLSEPKSPLLSADALDLVRAVSLANRRVYLTAQSQSQMMGMGTTLVAARFGNGIVTICHVGDSRAYRLRNGSLEPVTTDHSLVAELVARKEITPEQARTFAERNIITRALGTRPSVAIDVNVMSAATGDWYLLCSDGLCGVITDEDIGAVVNRSSGDPARATEALIAAANEAGGPDNITVAIAAISEAGAAMKQEPGFETIPESDEDAACLEMALLEKLFPSPGSGESSLDEASTDRIPIALSNPQQNEQ